jgi:hypothetical protein
MSLEAYKPLPLLQRCRWSAGTLHVRSLRLKVEPEASIWRWMTVRGLGIWSARSGVPDRHIGDSGDSPRCVVSGDSRPRPLRR